MFLTLQKSKTWYLILLHFSVCCRPDLFTFYWKTYLQANLKKLRDVLWIKVAAINHYFYDHNHASLETLYCIQLEGYFEEEID